MLSRLIDLYEYRQYYSMLLAHKKASCNNSTLHIQAGYTVTVFERNDRPGGLLQYGIPTMKLSKEVVARRIKLLTAEGISFKCNVDVGRDISASDLANE